MNKFHQTNKDPEIVKKFEDWQKSYANYLERKKTFQKIGKPASHKVNKRYGTFLLIPNKSDQMIQDLMNLDTKVQIAQLNRNGMNKTAKKKERKNIRKQGANRGA